jgi:hypothetical protein
LDARPAAPPALREDAVDFDELLRMEPDSGTTNIRNTASSHWKRWLGVDNRCVVPFTSFSEFTREAGGDIWFALSPDRPLAFFAGIWVPQWTSVRKVRTGPETIDLFAFLTTDPNAELGAVHPKAMPIFRPFRALIDPPPVGKLAAAGHSPPAAAYFCCALPRRSGRAASSRRKATAGRVPAVVPQRSRRNH